MLKPGDRIGRYRIEALLGQGGMGAVYWAHDETLQRRVALKVVRASEDGTQGDQAIARLLREARAAAGLEHPNVVAIHDVGEQDGGDARAFIAMEFVSGKTLRGYVGGDQAVKTKLGWLADVARALGAAHKHGIVHRDVKPENVMVRDDGVVKVLDFGIARRQNREIDPTGETQTPNDGLATLTQQGVAVGTPRYMAPEQLRALPLDGRTDQFSWGVLAWELLTGKPPWEAQDSMQLILAIANDDPPPLAPLVPGLPDGVEKIIRRTLAKRPDDRFESMDALVAELAPHVAGTGAQTTTVVGVDRNEWWRRFWWHLGISAAIGLVIFVVMCFVMYKPDDPSAAGAATSASVAAPRASVSAIAVTELPPPASSSKEALASYAEAMQAYRDGSGMAMFEALTKASQLDPSFAAAELRLSQSIDIPAEVTAHFQRATAGRKTLSERDRGMLDALAPTTVAEPFDYKESIKRFRALVAVWPGDAELWLQLAGVEQAAGESDAALEHASRAAELDPQFAPAFAEKAMDQALGGDLDGALTTIAACDRISTTTTSCSHVKLEILKQRGDCAGLEESARSLLARQPNDRQGLMSLAAAQGALGKPTEAMQGTMARAASRLPEHLQKLGHTFDQLRLHQFLLDYDAARADLATLHDVIKNDPTQLFRASLVFTEIGIDLDAGKEQDAGKLAASWLKEREGYQPPGASDVSAMMVDFLPVLLFAEVRGGIIKRDEQRGRRDEWVKHWEARLKPRDRGYLWMYAYAAFADTKEDADEAMAALPRFGGIPSFREGRYVDAYIGRTYMLAGKLDDAIGFLKHATHACSEYDSPIATIRAHVYLGEALEQKGDKAGACEAYESVFKRWTGAKPRSVSLEDAKKRAKAAGCKVP